MCCKNNNKCSPLQRNGIMIATRFGTVQFFGCQCPPASNHEKRFSKSAAVGTGEWLTGTLPSENININFC